MEFIIFCVIIFIFAYLTFLKTPKGKGLRGERVVKFKLGKNKENEKYVFHNCMFKQNNKTIQIDHILVSKKGVIVIETKNYAGRIYGDDFQNKWTQSLQYGKIKNEFYNPVKQNATHCYFIKSIIGIEIPIKSLVVFVQNNIEYIESQYTIGLNMLKKYLKRLPDVLSSDEIVNTAITIKSNLDLNTTNKQHVKNIAKMKENIANGICPRCGGNLVLRHGQYSDFIGCCNYPQCKFIKKD